MFAGHAFAEGTTIDCLSSPNNQLIIVYDESNDLEPGLQLGKCNPHFFSSWTAFGSTENPLKIEDNKVYLRNSSALSTKWTLIGKMAAQNVVHLKGYEVVEATYTTIDIKGNGIQELLVDFLMDNSVPNFLPTFNGFSQHTHILMIKKIGSENVFRVFENFYENPETGELKRHSFNIQETLWRKK